MTLEKQIATQKQNGLLTPVDLQIAEFLLKNPALFAKAPVTELAKMIHTSVASISRFAQRLGYSKLTDLRLELSKDSGQMLQYSKITKEGTTEARIQEVATFNKDTIDGVTRVLSPENLRQAVEIIDRGTRVVFVGFGGSASVARDAFHKFSRTGKDVSFFKDSHELAIFATTLDASCVIVAFSDSGETKDMNEVLAIARAAGMKIIAVTRCGKSSIMKLADVCLYTLTAERCGSTGTLISRVASYTVADMLYVEYYTLHAKQIEELQNTIDQNMEILKLKR